MVPVATSRAFAQQLTQSGWPVEVVELPTGHGGIAGAELDPTGDGYQPATDAGDAVGGRRGRRAHRGAHSSGALKPTVVKSGCSNVAAPKLTSPSLTSTTSGSTASGMTTA